MNILNLFYEKHVENTVFCKCLGLASLYTESVLTKFALDIYFSPINILGPRKFFEKINPYFGQKSYKNQLNTFLNNRLVSNFGFNLCRKCPTNFHFS